jgi:hypothetical protein
VDITNAQFKSYCGSDDYVNDSKAWLEAYAAKQVVVTVNADGIGHISDQEPVKRPMFMVIGFSMKRA